MQKPRLLIIDDDKDYLELLHEALAENFDVTCASNLKDADKFVSNNELFDIALVDENIGDDKGSKWIKSQVEHHTVATSFVLYSGLANEDAVLKGLECGADDFLAKPISLLALNNKLKKLISYQDKIHSFETEICSKDRVINISMAQASKYGSCMQLTSRLNHCFTLEKIRDEMFSFLYSMNLQGCIAFYPINEKPLFFSAKNGFCSPVEIDVMKLLKVKPRLYRFSSRTIFNHPLCSILILNLEEGAIDTDIYIDALASVIECVGARIAFITYKNSLVHVQSKIQQAVSATKQMIAISKHHQQEVMNEIVTNIGMSFHVLEMSDEQEEYLTNLVHTSLKKHSQDDINFLEVTQLLDGALASVDELEVLNQQQEEEIVDIDEEDELF
ncbi:MAG: response regulator [Colwellia sp.]|jgi:ActR/RegA family two-component response regulator|uniref:response regulator n=1 Tax=Colwellia sp. Bg11-12 TaxID=2759817 RepID=UPI0015F6CFEC|nr:response regulator [Colwellia sp. Bg11-12]MBA6265769.1 response regulator transcription factor [Colwellia sp. Bg11-12]